MNIFALSHDPREAAEFHNDKHVVKMILESGQMLCAAHWLGWERSLDLSGTGRVKDRTEILRTAIPMGMVPPWRMTHIGHPCTRWTQRTIENYRWHSDLGLALCKEYTLRYKKVHKSESVHEWLRDNPPPSFEEVGSGLTPFAVCVPSDCAVSQDPVECYTF